MAYFHTLCSLSTTFIPLRVFGHFFVNNFHGFFLHACALISKSTLKNMMPALHTSQSQSIFSHYFQVIFSTRVRGLKWYLYYEEIIKNIFFFWGIFIEYFTKFKKIPLGNISKFFGYIIYNPYKYAAEHAFGLHHIFSFKKVIRTQNSSKLQIFEKL